MWVGETIHLIHQPMVSWARLQNFCLTVKWAGLGSLIFNLASDESIRASKISSLWHVSWRFNLWRVNY